MNVSQITLKDLFLLDAEKASIREKLSREVREKPWAPFLDRIVNNVSAIPTTNSSTSLPKPGKSGEKWRSTRTPAHILHRK